MTSEQAAQWAPAHNKQVDATPMVFDGSRHVRVARMMLVALALRPAGSELQDGADRVAERVSSTGGRIHVQYCMS